jgi:hypothetical protein
MRVAPLFHRASRWRRQSKSTASTLAPRHVPFTAGHQRKAAFLSKPTIRPAQLMVSSVPIADAQRASPKPPPPTLSGAFDQPQLAHDHPQRGKGGFVVEAYEPRIAGEIGWEGRERRLVAFIPVRRLPSASRDLQL